MWRRGEGALLDVALSRVCAWALNAYAGAAVAGVPRVVAAPRTLGPEPAAVRSLGADTAAVLSELGVA